MGKYSKFFNLEKNPFGETPNPEFYLETPQHKNALDKLNWAVETNKCFSLLTGEVGAGKTLLTRLLISGLNSDIQTALVLFPKLETKDFLLLINEELGVPLQISMGHSSKDLIEQLNHFLVSSFEQGRQTLLVVDEAQSLSDDALETIRLLTNLETKEEKLLQIVLVGQPELLARLDQDNLRQLKQRICIAVHLDGLTQQETDVYIRHRLELSGEGNLLRFDPKVVRAIHEHTQGIPRKINRLCEILLLAAQTNQVRLIDMGLYRETLGIGLKHKILNLFG